MHHDLGGSGTISYQWKRGAGNIGTDSGEYTIQAADAGSTLTVTVTRSGNSGSVTSGPIVINNQTNNKVGQTVEHFNITGTGSFTYDGTAKTVSITPNDSNYTGAITVLYNSAEIPPVNAGEYTVTFDISETEGYYAVNGLEAGTLIINKADGGAVNAPVAAIIVVNSVTLETVTAGTGQTVEYAVNTYNSTSGADWQTGTTFTGLTAGTAYYFFARTADNDNYYEGQASAGTLISTTQNANIGIIGYWADYDGSIGIRRYDGGQIMNNIIGIVPGSAITFTPNDSGYSSHKWTLNGTLEGNAVEYTFNSASKESDKNYIIGLYVEKNGKPYYTQITVMIRPALTGTVSISGTAQVGQTLTANTNSLGGNGTIYYQWNRGGVAISGANNSTYVVQADDAGYTISVTVSRYGNAGSVTSAPTAAVTALLPALTGTVSITGTAQAGHTLTANTSNLGGSGTIYYEWTRNGTTIIGYNSTYTVQDADAGCYIIVYVSRSGYSGNKNASTSIIPSRFEGTWLKANGDRISFYGNAFTAQMNILLYEGTYTVNGNALTFYHYSGSNLSMTIQTTFQFYDGRLIITDHSARGFTGTYTKSSWNNW